MFFAQERVAGVLQTNQHSRVFLEHDPIATFETIAARLETKLNVWITLWLFNIDMENHHL